MDAHYKTKFQRFVSNPPRSSFKKLIVSTPRLLRNLHTMSLEKAAPDGLKDRECEKMALRERPPIPYVPEKDSVQETVSSYKDDLKMLIKEGTELRVPIWHSGTREAFLIHVGSAREAIKKKGYFKSFEDHSETYADKREKVKELKDQLVALREASAAPAKTSGQAGTSRKSKDPKETTVEASKEGSAALRATIKAELKQALDAAEEATTKRDKAAKDMFQLYANLLSVNARYAWN
jgi:hypothetical protein